jgi:GTP cyclohydrolase II
MRVQTGGMRVRTDHGARRITRRSDPVPLATPYGEFQVFGFELPSGRTYLALAQGDVADGYGVLVRLHSECVTGDTLGSFRCDCGPQLASSMRRLAAEERGLLLYAVGDEGRGIGIVNKLRAYRLQDLGLDTVEANAQLGLPIDSRDFREAADILRSLGVRSVRLLTNNPAKVAGIREAGIRVDEVLPVTTSPNRRSLAYLRTKRERLGHEPFGEEPGETPSSAVDVAELVGDPHGRRPYVVLKYAQTVDGRTATSTGDSRWISSAEERVLSHSVRASCDAVAVGIGTVVADDPQLTVRLVPGPSPMRVVFDSSLSIPDSARLFAGGPTTLLFTTERSEPGRRRALVERGVRVHVVPEGPAGLDLGAALAEMRVLGITTLLVEGGARIATSLLAARLVHRVIVSIAPTLLGTGRNAVGDLGIDRIAAGIHIERPVVRIVGGDVVIAGDLGEPPPLRG